MKNNLKKLITYKIIFYFLLALLFVGLTLFYLLDVSYHIKFILILPSLGLIGIIYLVFLYRKKEIEEIKEVLKKITSNTIKNAEEIKFNPSLREVEDEFKNMFCRHKNDFQHLKKLEQVRTEFLGNVSHELRTPIFSIQGFLETLLDGALDDPKVNRVFLQKAVHHTNNLNNLLNELIDISMIESGQMKMSFRYFNVHEFLKSIISEYKVIADKKNLILSLHSPNPNLELFGDKNRLKQVLSNLITNAIKYTETGSIEIGVLEESNFGKIYVQDTGIGISEKDVARIFERFYRIDKDRSREMGGTGLGLAIVKHIIEAHDSRISVESKPEFGSLFHFKLKK